MVQTPRNAKSGSSVTRVSLRAMTIVGAAAFVAVIASLYVSVGYFAALVRADREATTHLRDRAAAVAAVVRQFIVEVEADTEFAAQMIARGAIPASQDAALGRFFFDVLRRENSFRALYLGREDGGFVFLRRIEDGGDLWYEFRRIESESSRGGTRIEPWGREGAPMGFAFDIDDGFDPRERPWYKAAIRDGKPAWSAPYSFWSDGEVGISHAIPLDCGDGMRCVVGVDVTLDMLTRFLSTISGGAGIGAFIRWSGGEIVAASARTDPKSLETAFGAAARGAQGFDIGGKDYLLLEVDLRATGVAWSVGVYVPRLDFGIWMRSIARSGVPVAVLALTLVVAAALVLWYLLVRDLNGLAGLATALGDRDAERAGRFAHSRFKEVAAVGTALRRMDAELTRHSEGMARALAAAVRADQSKNEFLAQMSHELRTPLNAVIGFAELLSATAGPHLTERQKSYVEDILTAGRHQLSLIDSVLDLAQFQSGKLALRLSEIDLSHVVADGVMLIEGRAAEKGIVLERRLAPGVLLRADAMKLRQIAANLLSNAVKFTDQGGRVRIDCGIAGDGAPYMSVQDDGIGMSVGDLATVRQPFIRAAPAEIAIREGGVGIGLAVVQALVDLHRGVLDIRSARGEGTTATVQFPVDALLRKTD